MAEAKRRSIIELSCDEAREFLLKQESYCTIELPPYFKFDELISSITQVLEGKSLSDLQNSCLPQDIEDVNYRILNNKDGRYEWRPLELIHPALYISLVNNMTEHWEPIIGRFHYFRNNAKIKCLSLPVEPLTDEKDKAGQISHWWEEVEQKSIELSMDYEFIIHTDIVDCYAAFYTHAIPWALHRKSEAKKMRDEKYLIGNIIDKCIRSMRQGQTNGIPQGSVLMDFIAEIVLGYADTTLTERINCQKIKDYQILRYRDDYRIFVNSPQDGERILKCLTEVMIELGLSLNPVKTSTSSEVIQSSIKDDKLNWILRKQIDKKLQSHLLIIHQHSMKYPNAGSLVNAMCDYHERLRKIDKCGFSLPLIAIIVDIAYRNPRTYAISAAILSKLISFLETKCEKQKVIEKILQKFSHIPNTGHMKIWLQRVSYLIDPNIYFDERLCRLVCQEDVQIWNNDWISSKNLLKAIDPKEMVNREELDAITPVVSSEEVQLWASYP